MNLENLFERHKQEVNDYWHGRAKRLFELQKSQNDVISNYLVLDKKSRKAVDNLLTKQRQAWEKMEKDELNLLLHIQTLEKENRMKDEAKRLRLIQLLTAKEHNNNKERDR
jgi:hypothetical protein